MSRFSATVIGGPSDGMIFDVIRAPQDGERITYLPEARRAANVPKWYAVYEYSWSDRAWKFVEMTKRRITSDISM